MSCAQWALLCVRGLDFLRLVVWGFGLHAVLHAMLVAAVKALP